MLRCDICEDRFETKSDLASHVSSIHNESKPKCTICNQIFLQENHFAKHMRDVHDQKKPFGCNFCDAMYERKNYLKVHIQTVHEGKKGCWAKKPKCHMCDIVFDSRLSILDWLL